ncbi:MAG: glycosyltransferase [Vicingaceae bacterium]|nr:glycosyltransferase [Vicingaceae bacterium]
MPKKRNLAILSPSQNAYSETFIQAHKNYINANIKYYFKGIIPQNLEGYGNINPIIKKGVNKLISHLKKDVLLAERTALKNSLKKEKIEVVLAEYGNLASEVVPVCKELNLPLIAHFHGFDASVYNVLEDYNNYINLFEYATKIIAVSQVMEKQLLSIGCPREKLILNTYGPNEEFEKVIPTFEKENFIAVGRFTDKKAPYYLILAFKEVVKKFPNARLIVAGDGFLKNTCLNLIKHFNLSKNIELPGIITPEQFKNYLTTSRAFVQHSITAENGDMEGTPLAILESSIAGVPVISTNHAGISDVIIHNQTGYLVNEHDVQGMSNYMLELLENKDKARALGEAGKKNIQENFNMAQHIEELNQIIYKAAEN